MQKGVVALVLILAAAGVAWYVASRAPNSTSRPSPPALQPQTPTPPSNRPPPVAPPVSVSAKALLVLQSKDIEAIQALAAEWRRSARQGAPFRAALMEILLDPATPPEVRALAALVLGSLPGREAMEALARALEASKDPAWTRTLLLALGSEKPPGDDDDIFGLAGSPRAVETSIGLAIRIRGAIVEAPARSLIIPHLRVGGDAGVRWAAALALTDSAGFEEVRRAFLETLPGEADPAAQGQVTKALTDWAAGETAESPGRAEVVAAIFDGALRADANALRLRSEDGLKRMAWTEPDVLALTPRIGAGPFDQRRWAIAVLAGATSRSEIPARAEVFRSLSSVVEGDPDAKVRELAVTALSSFPDQPPASKLLVASLADNAWHVRAAAARALGRMGRLEENVDALRKVEAEDGDERVRRAAAETLKLLTPR